jgi:hypothetical protein
MPVSICGNVSGNVSVTKCVGSESISGKKAVDLKQTINLWLFCCSGHGPQRRES